MPAHAVPIAGLPGRIKQAVRNVRAGTWLPGQGSARRFRGAGFKVADGLSPNQRYAALVIILNFALRVLMRSEKQNGGADQNSLYCFNVHAFQGIHNRRWHFHKCSRPYLSEYVRSTHSFLPILHVTACLKDIRRESP